MSTQLTQLLLKAAEQAKVSANRFYTPAQSDHFRSVIHQKMGVVCQIKTLTDQGTGCLIGGNLLLTNYHVLPDEATIRKSEAVFFRVIDQDAEKKKTTFEVIRLDLSQACCICCSPHKIKEIEGKMVPQPADPDHLDFTIIALTADPYLEQIQDRTFDLFKSIEPQFQSLACILQHPDVIDSTTSIKGDLKWTLGLIQRIEECSVLYDPETAPGSSGGAVMNEKGDLMVLHYQGIGKRDLDPRHPYCNAGVLITEIVKYLERKGEKARIEELIGVYRKEHPFLEAKLTEVLKAYYRSCDRIPLLFDEDETLPIQNYAPLLMIGNDERKASRFRHYRNHRGKTHNEALFESNKPVNLDFLFEHEILKEKKEKRVLVLGGAGIGKSTFCQYIAYQWSVGKLWPQFKAVFWIKLRYLSKEFYPEGREYGAYDLLAGRDFKHRGIKFESYSTLLNDEHFREHTLVIFDGDDELPAEAERGHLSIALNELKQKFPHILITSRHQGVSHSERKEKTTVEIVGFNEKSIDKYIGDFFDDPEKKLVGAEQNFRTYLKQFPLVRSLAHIPLNLAIFCRLFKERENPLNPGGNLTITTLYEKINEWLCKRFLLRPGVCQQYTINDIIQEYHPENFDEVIPLMRALKALAWEAMKKDRFYLTEVEVNSYFGKFKLKVGQNKNFGLFKIDQGIGSFIHLTFQEYFTALYLSDLYLEGKTQECQSFISKYKFNPNFFRVFWMAAGYLSTKDEKVLKIYFNDLLSEPYDLAVGFELRLLARCFEECKDTSVIPQYILFIEHVLIYLHEYLPERLKADLFIENPRLLSHEKVVQLFTDNLRDNRKLNSTSRILREIADHGQILPEKILTTFINILKDSHFQLKSHKMNLVLQLEDLTKSQKDLPKEILDAFITFLKDPQANTSDKQSAVRALGKLVENRQSFFKEAIDTLISILNDPIVEPEIKYTVAYALTEIAKSKQVLPEESVDALVILLKTSTLSLVKQPVASALGEASKILKNRSREIAEVLTELLKISNEDSSFKCSVATTLREVVKSGQTISIESVKVLISLLRDAQLESACMVLGEVVISGITGSKEALEALILFLKDSQINPSGKTSAVEALGEVVISGLTGSKEALEALILFLKDSQINPSGKTSAVRALTESVNRGQTLPKEAIEVLILLLTDSQITFDDKYFVIHVFEAIVRNGQTLPKETIGALATVLNVKYEGDIPEVKSSAAWVLGKIAIKEKAWSKEILDVIIAFLKEPRSEYWAQRSAAVALIEMAQTEISLSKEVLEALLTPLKDAQADSIAKSSAARALGVIAQSEQPISKEAIDVLFLLLVDPVVSTIDSDAKSSVVEVLGELAQNEQDGSKKVLEIFIGILKNRQADSDLKGYVVQALAEVAKSGQALPNEMLEYLIIIINDPQITSEAKGYAAWALASMANNGIVLENKALDGLLALLKTPQKFEWLFWAQASAAEVLGEVAKSGQTLSKEIIDALIAVIKSPDTNFWKYSAAWALGDIAESGQVLPKEAFEVLIQIYYNPENPISFEVIERILEECCKFSNKYDYQDLHKLFFLTGHAFFYHEGVFYASSHQDRLITKYTDERHEIYQELFSESKLRPLSSICALKPFFQVEQVSTRSITIVERPAVILERNRASQNLGRSSAIVQSPAIQFVGKRSQRTDHASWDSKIAPTDYTSKTIQDSHLLNYLPLDEQGLISNSIKISSNLDEVVSIKPHSPLPSKWDETTIATLLWLNSKIHVSDEMILKINSVHNYLSPRGFELRGVEADGNCFCTAFLRSYQALTRRIPLLDSSPNKVAYLRETIASQYKRSLQGSKNGTRVEQIKKDKEWLTAFDEGDLLAVALSIPIRLITVNIEGKLCGISDMLTFTDGRRPRQEWDTIPELEKPSECITIADVGGHFLYTQKIK
ncbi:MAG: NACHT domain-containing protein [Verrucomicrobia bacterium]|nr:NACHT domain-containing protein [Verrucomicrobiota bacterium]